MTTWDDNIIDFLGRAKVLEVIAFL